MGTPEWKRMWDELSRYHDIDYVSPLGEEWQYMGTDEAGHSFRHRDYHGKRVYARIPVQMSNSPQ